MTNVSVYIGLGSNLADPEKQIQSALLALDKIDKSRLISSSGLFKSKPMGPQDQPDYINAAALIETNLSAEDLLDELQRIEKQQGRVRHRHWGERTLDLDILLYGEQILQTPRLTVPHAGIAERDFVLLPLAKINPNLVIPGKGKLFDVIKNCADNGIEYLGK